MTCNHTTKDLEPHNLMFPKQEPLPVKLHMLLQKQNKEVQDVASVDSVDRKGNKLRATSSVSVLRSCRKPSVSVVSDSGPQPDAWRSHTEVAIVIVVINLKYLSSPIRFLRSESQ